MIVAIDGPSASGKSSIAKRIAKLLNFEYIDTGAMYRLLALKLYKEKKDFSLDVLSDLDIKIENGRFYLDNTDVSDMIRTNEISKIASKVSKLREVRDFMVSMQRKMSEDKDIVLDGRDIGTFVFPNADIKFYVTASKEIRAKRRVLEEPNLTYEIILEDIIKRDEQDMNRAYAPLKQAENAILVDTSDMNLDEAVNIIYNMIKERVKW